MDILTQLQQRFCCVLIITTCIMIVLVSCKHADEHCKQLGFNSSNLFCPTCEKLTEFNLEDIYDTCQECCTVDEYDAMGLQRYPRAILEVCACKFGTYPQIQAFVKSDLPKKYKNLQIKYISNRDPIIKLYDATNQLKDELDIHKWDTHAVDEFFHTHLLLD